MAKEQDRASDSNSVKAPENLKQLREAVSSGKDSKDIKAVADKVIDSAQKSELSDKDKMAFAIKTIDQARNLEQQGYKARPELMQEKQRDNSPKIERDDSRER